MKNNSITYYAGANSCDGYVSYWNEYITQMQNIIILKNTMYNTAYIIFHKIIDKLDKNNIKYEIIIRAGSKSDIEGIIITGLKFAITTYSSIDLSDFPTEKNVFIYDFGKCISENKKKESDLFTLPLISEYEKHMKNIFTHFSVAKKNHDNWEKIYISNMNFERANKEAINISKTLFGEKSRINKPSDVNRFFGSMIPDGTVNYIDNITEGFKKRIFIKGRPGTGKSTFLRNLGSYAVSNGYSTETYHCSFDKNSLDMIVVRELSICIFDSTAPHEMFPKKIGDVILDIYDICVNKGTDEKYSAELAEISSSYKNEMNLAQSQLMASEGILNQISDVYLKCIDNKTEQDIQDEVLSKFNSIISN